MNEQQEGRIRVFVSVLLCACSGCNPENPGPQGLSQGIVIQQEGMQASQEELAEKITAAGTEVMNQSGLVGAAGGVHVKLLKTDEHEILLPLPQLSDGQVPLSFYISSKPQDAVVEYRLRKRQNSNDIVSVHLKGERNQEVQVHWSSVIVVASKTAVSSKAAPDPYREPTACVQSEAKEVAEIAQNLWPENGQVSDFAKKIQRFVREMKPAKRPRSLDALGILDSGANGICTANANLASALLRSKGVASRSIAVVPPISQRLEMHRIVEYFDEGEWRSFDPSSLQTDVPTKPWQNIVMAKTTIADENIAMNPRMGSMLGCPYAQEIELVSNGISLTGQDFFWTIAKPIAKFEVDEDAIAFAVEAWKRYLEVGALSQGQVKAASAKNSKEFSELLHQE